MRIDGLESILRRGQLRSADVGRPVDDLPLEVAVVDDVEVDDPDPADAGGRKVHRSRRAEPTRADAQHAARLQLPLTVDADLRHDQVAAVALDFLVGQLRQGLVSSLKADATHVLGRRCAAGDRRDDADRVARRDRRLLFLQVADVLVVQVHVDEAPQLALVVIQVRLQAAVPARQVGEQLADGRAVGLDRILLIRVRSQRSWNQDFRRH